MGVDGEAEETSAEGTTQAPSAPNRRKVRRRSSLVELWNGLTQSVQTLATDGISKTLADTSLLGFSTESGPGGLAGGAMRLRVKTLQGDAASPERRPQNSTKGKFASRKLVRTVSARVINLTPRAPIPKTPTVVSALGRRLTRKSEPGRKSLELNRQRTESIEIDQQAVSARCVVASCLWSPSCTSNKLGHLVDQPHREWLGSQDRPDCKKLFLKQCTGSCFSKPVHLCQRIWSKIWNNVLHSFKCVLLDVLTVHA